MDKFLSSLVDKINDLLFEVLGLLLPSLILCIIAFEPVLYIKDFSINKNNSLLKDVDIKSIESFWIFLFLIAFFYVIGNVIKVVSKVYCDLGKSIFDDTIFALIYYMFNKRLPGEEDNSRKETGGKEEVQKDAKCQEKSKTKLKNIPVFTILNVFYEWIKKTLSFSTKNYDEIFECMYIELAVNKLELFNKEEKDKKWFLFYKKAITILEQENIDTLSYKHLSKYNSFRSLECVFFCAIIYNTILSYKDININYLIYYIILGFNIICLVSFHEKYKRYWKLCGNEVITGLDYFYNYKKGNK